MDKEKRVARIEEKNQMIISERKLTKVGNSISITIPPKWLEQHNLKEGDDITIMLNSDIKVLSPASRQKFYDNAFKKEIKKND